LTAEFERADAEEAGGQDLVQHFIDQFMGCGARIALSCAWRGSSVYAGHGRQVSGSLSAVVLPTRVTLSGGAADS
jgi:hypothetical protein